MKTDLTDVNDTRKNLLVEIPSDVVDAEIDRIARDYSRRAKIPGFRPGKAPPRVVKQRFKEQILHDVAHDLIPRAVDDALRERGVEAVDTPDIRDVNVEEGRALTFTASFDTLPAFNPGDYSTVSLRRSSKVVEEAAVFIDGPGLAGLLPLALSPYAAGKLTSTPSWEIFQDGLQAIERGQVLFKDNSQRQRILQAHNTVNNLKQVFGE